MHAVPEIPVSAPLPAIVSALRRAVVRRRAPLWAAAILPAVALAWFAPLPALLLLGASLAWVIWDARALRARVDGQWARWLDAAVPAFEDSAALLAASAPASPLAALQRARLLMRLDAALGADDYGRIARARIALHPGAPLLAVAACGAVLVWQALAATPHQAPANPASSAAAAAQPGELVLRVTPPAYTGVAPFDSGARDIEAPQYSAVRWCLKRAGDAPVTIELSDGRTLSAGAQCAQWSAAESLFWRVRGQGGARYNIRVAADQAPAVAIVAPQQAIHVLAPGTRSVLLSVSARDDYAVARASLHMTLARGSGENVRFSDREMPLPQGRDPKLRSWSKEWALADLGMEPGDELYFFVRATDNSPEHPHTAQSPTYTLRLPGPAGESVESSALPTMVKPESLRSQRQIIIDTEQLVADAPKLARAALRERSEAIADDQAQLRRRYGQFLGEESTLFGDEHDHGAKPAKGKDKTKETDGHEHEHKHEHEHEDEREHGNAHGHEEQRDAAKAGSNDAILAQYGHAHDEQDNATIFDPQTKEVLRRALKAMWEAEKSLRAIVPKTALPPEYTALEAIKELQQAERVYLHRTAFVPPAIKEEKRMTGDIVGALSARRAQRTGDVDGDSEAAAATARQVRELVLALAPGAPLPALWSKSAREAIAARMPDDERRLGALRAVQDVADGCEPCRAVLRAHLRSTIETAPVLLQARPQADSPFRQAWRGKEQQ